MIMIYLFIRVLGAAAVQVEVLTHPHSVSLLSVGVVLEDALVSPPLSYHRQLLVPHKFLHVGSGGLRSIGFLAPGNLGSQSIVFVKKSLFTSLTQVSVNSFSSAGIRRSLNKHIQGVSTWMPLITI